MRIDITRDTEEVFDYKKNIFVNKRLDKNAVWVFGTNEELDKFENYMDEYFGDSNCQCREEDGSKYYDDDIDDSKKIYSDYYSVCNYDIKDFKYFYKKFKKEEL